MTIASTRPSANALTHRMLRCGTIGALLFVAVFLVDGATRSGYSPMRHPVSALSLGPRGWVQIVNFVVTGILMVVFAVGVRRALRSGRGATWGPLLLGVFGLGLVLSGVFVMDPMLGYPPGTPPGLPAETSLNNNLHDLFGVVVFGSLPSAAFVLARRFRSDPAAHRWAIYSTATGIAMVALFIAFGAAWEQESRVAGLIQRIMIAVGWGWIALLAIHVARRRDPPAPDGPREEALRSAVHDLAAAVHRGDATEEELAAAMETVRQVPVDVERMMNALHVPNDAGKHEDALRALLHRIPDGWGRWIGCGAGWYPILARLEERLRDIDPDYEVHQIKEKFGTLRFYWTGRNYAAGEAAVVTAEAESAQTCELCGNPGRLRTRASWLRTLCDDCALAEGYEDLTKKK